MKEFSYGVIPVRWIEHQWQVFLVQHFAGHWGFPKGRKEEGEIPLETAERELREETGLQIIHVLTPSPFHEVYHYSRNGCLIEKKVDYFLAEVGNTPILQAAEIKSALWLPLTEAEKKLSFSEGKKLCRLAAELLIQLKR